MHHRRAGSNFLSRRHGRDHRSLGAPAERVVTGLPSLGTVNQSEVLGPHDIALTKAGPLVTIGLGTDPQRRAQLGPAGTFIGQIVRVGPSGASAFADLAGYEAANNPDRDQPGTGPDSNPYGLLPYRDGAVVTDAGGNDLLRLDRQGRISTLAVFPTTPTPNPFGGPDIPMQFVPTTVTSGPGGELYVGQLTGFPFPVGGAKVWRVVPGQTPTVFAEGFTNIADIAFDNKGRLLVLEIFANGLLSGDPTGALTRWNETASTPNSPGPASSRPRAWRSPTTARSTSPTRARWSVRARCCGCECATKPSPVLTAWLVVAGRPRRPGPSRPDSKFWAWLSNR